MEAAKLRLDAAKAMLESTTKQHQSGVASQNELLKARAESEQAQYQLRKAATMLELYRISKPQESGKEESKSKSPAK